MTVHMSPTTVAVANATASEGSIKFRANELDTTNDSDNDNDNENRSGHGNDLSGSMEKHESAAGKQMPGTPVTVDSTMADSTASFRTSLTVDIPTPRHDSVSSSSSSSSSSLHSQRCLRNAPRYALPSPSRGRIDAQYARRLAAAPSPAAQSHSQMLPPDVTATLAENVIIPPPRVNRHGKSFIFDCNNHSSAAVAANTVAASTMAPSSTPLYTRKSVLARATSDPRGVLSLPAPYSRRVSSLDRGFSDRFIPSRVTSSLDMDLWGSRQERSSSMPSNATYHGHLSSNTPNNSINSNTNNNTNHNNNMNGNNTTANNGTANRPNANTNVNGAGASTNNGSTSTAANNGNNNNNNRSSDASTTATRRGNSNHYGGTESNGNQMPQQSMHNVLLRSELLGENIPAGHADSRIRFNSSGIPLSDAGNQLRYNSARQMHQRGIFASAGQDPHSVIDSFGLTPVGSDTSQRLMSVPQKRKRRIAKVPFKVLDAPALQDDFYLNLVDWSAQNVLAVGLGSCVYLWSACTSKVTKLCDLSQNEDIVTSVSWANRGFHLAVGTNRGEVQMWDCIKCKKARTMTGHTNRVGTLAWNGPTLASGSRDRMIYLRDVRMQAPYTHRLNSHKQEVCGLKWSFDEPSFLASGGNDNQLYVVDSRNPTSSLHNFKDHTAAVKAIAWSPHQHGLLASGGGTADRCIRFWNTLSGTNLNCVDTGSQVCNLAWSKNCNEIVSTHGYSLNQIVLWRYPSMSKVATLTGHTYRVLYLAMSPDGSTIVTGAGDETLRFWQVFPGPRSDGKNNDGGLLFPSTLGSVIR